MQKTHFSCVYHLSWCVRAALRRYYCERPVLSLTLRYPTRRSRQHGNRLEGRRLRSDSVRRSRSAITCPCSRGCIKAVGLDRLESAYYGVKTSSLVGASCRHRLDSLIMSSFRRLTRPARLHRFLVVRSLARSPIHSSVTKRWVLKLEDNKRQPYTATSGRRHRKLTAAAPFRSGARARSAAAAASVVTSGELQYIGVDKISSRSSVRGRCGRNRDGCRLYRDPGVRSSWCALVTVG